MRKLRAFSLIELLVVLSIVTLLIAVLLPALGAARKNADQMRSTSRLRGVHQGMVIHSQSNNAYLPGFNRDGQILPDTLSDTGLSGPGHTASARLWVLVVNHYMGPDLLISPAEARVRWDSGALTTANHSYGLLEIADSVDDAGRRTAWKDHASSLSALMSDRNVGPDAADVNVQSLWTTRPGAWWGAVLWGDNHAVFTKTNREFVTRYADWTTTNDNLFALFQDYPAAGATDSSENDTANAMMTWD